MAGTNPNGKQLLRASLELFRADRSIAALPVISLVTTLVAMILIGGGIAAVLALLGLNGGIVAAVAAFFCLLIASFFATLFGVAVVYAASERIEGGDPTVKGCIARAWTRKGRIFSWAVLSAIVGTIINAIQEKVPAGQLLGALGGLAWAVATWLVVPVIAFEDVSPVEAVKRSSHIFKERFGTVAKGALRFGILFLGWTLLGFAMLIGGIALAVAVPAVAILGIALAGLGFVFLIGLSVYMSVVNMYLRTIIYRFATGKSVPDLGIDLNQAFAR